MSEKTVHAGHRARLRERFLKEGLSGFSEHEVLELLLMFAIPQKDVNPLARYGSMMSSKMKIRTSGDPTAKIAELMLQGNTRGMIKSMHNIRTMGLLDPKVSGLSNRLLQTEQANIDQMKEYL